MTRLGHMVFSSQFLATDGLFRHWVERCPLRFSNPDAPTMTNLLGTIIPSVLAVDFRYLHITGLCDHSRFPSLIRTLNRTISGGCKL